MSDRLQLLSNSEGELVCVRVGVEPRLLEELLECLAEVDFPINPQIYHGRPTVVEFPAYERRITGLCQRLRLAGFASSSVTVRPMLEALVAHAS